MGDAIAFWRCGGYAIAVWGCERAIAFCGGEGRSLFGDVRGRSLFVDVRCDRCLGMWAIGSTEQDNY